MKDKPKEYDPSKITGFFDKNTEIKGDLKFQGSFRIDGRFKGNILSDSILIIGEQGQVEADVKVGHIIVNGEIRGTIHASGRAEINSQGRVFGTLISPKLLVEEGAFLEARCQTSSSLPELPAKKDAPKKAD
jgi:cytoskeletal protein CcmA (bactofilin family)